MKNMIVHINQNQFQNMMQRNSKKIAKENNCPLVLGSATPDLTTYYKAQQGEITLLALTKRANNSKLPSVDVVDLKMELANGNRSMLSYKLHDAIQKILKKKDKQYFS